MIRDLLLRRGLLLLALAALLNAVGLRMTHHHVGPEGTCHAHGSSHARTACSEGGTTCSHHSRAGHEEASTGPFLAPLSAAEDHEACRVCDLLATFGKLAPVDAALEAAPLPLIENLEAGILLGFYEPADLRTTARGPPLGIVS